MILEKDPNSSAPGTFGAREYSVISARDSLLRREFSVFSAPGTLGTRWGSSDVSPWFALRLARFQHFSLSCVLAMYFSTLLVCPALQLTFVPFFKHSEVAFQYSLRSFACMPLLTSTPHRLMKETVSRLEVAWSRSH